MSRVRRLYWDAGCFIALFNREPTTDAEKLEALKAAFDDMLYGHLKIVTSDMFRAEVFGPGFTGPAQQIYNDWVVAQFSLSLLGRCQVG